MVLTAEPFREPRIGEPVRFTMEDLGAPIQDGYRFCAVEVWRPGAKVQPNGTVVFGPSEAYSSHLTITFDVG